MPRTAKTYQGNMSLRDIFLGFCENEEKCISLFRTIIFKKITRYKPEQFTEEGEWTDVRLDEYFEILVNDKAELQMVRTTGGKTRYIDKPDGRGFISYVKHLQEIPDKTMHAWFKNWVQNIVTSNTPKWYNTFYNAVIVGMRKDKFNRFDRFGPKRDALGLSAWVGRIKTITQRDYPDLFGTWARMWKRNDFPRRTERKILCQERLHILKTMFDEIGEWVKAAPFYKAVQTLFPYDQSAPDNFARPLHDNDINDRDENDPAAIIELKEQQNIIQSMQANWNEQLGKCFAKSFSKSLSDHYLVLYLLLSGEVKLKCRAAQAVNRCPAFATRTIGEYKKILAKMAAAEELTRTEKGALGEYVKVWLKKKINK